MRNLVRRFLRTPTAGSPSGRKPPHRARASGFTVLELLVVTVIIAIAFFAVRPVFGGVIRGWQERNAIRQIVSLFTAARTEAVVSGRLIRVTYDPTVGSFHADRQPTPEEDRDLFEPVTLMGRREVRLPASLAIDSIEVDGLYMPTTDASSVFFYPDGRTDGALIVLVRSSGMVTSLEVAPATGRVRLDA